MADQNYQRWPHEEVPETPSTRLVEPPLSRNQRETMHRPPARRQQGAPQRPRPRPQPHYDDDQSRRSPGGASIGLTLVTLMALGVLGFLGYQQFLAEDEGTGEATAEADPTQDGTAEDGSEQPAENGTATEGAEAEENPAAPTTPIAPPSPPFVQATLTGKDMVLTGTLPSQELVDQTTQAATVAYAPFLQSELQVDPSLPQEPWLAAAPVATVLAQTMTEGSVTLADGRVIVAGKTASEQDVVQLEALLTQATGLPVERGEIEITNLRPAIYLLAGSDGQIALSGALPNEEVRAGIVAAASAIYGPDNVLDASTVDPGVNTALWMFNPEGLLGTLSQFPDYEVRLDGGAFSASLSGGNIFPPDSTEVSEAFTQVLNFGVVVLTRDPTMTITIEGHTDSQGDDEYNLNLSQARADSVATYFVAAGIQEERVTAIGKGEAEPAAPNDTAEGRSRNRRVEFSLSSAG